MALEDAERRAYSFGAQADAYDEYRPGYPDAAVRWALEPVAGRRPLRVLDLAAGTGKLTDAILRIGADVVAVEPDSAMRDRLHRRLPDVRALPGTAEQIPLADGEVDAVLVGHAMHWFDRDRAFPEIARTVAPGGVLAALWNAEDTSVDWVWGLMETSGSNPSLNRQRALISLDAHPLFPAVEHEEFPHSARHDAESLIAKLATHSQFLIMAEDEQARLLDQVREYLRERPETGSGEFDLPMITMARRAVRA
jgi:SAM-dependent methyltransferase